ncbi:uncharacterized protein LOC129574518 [Sitodiplosis mosellana]|uniref:uncharacterized protein LOC129574518 n=1 Tax=Sitodiplosis mosellana TaxID=263140 RepID=UPI002444E717|nr:uncharacterized protein LOC129574518 [Sitodiplosis mosellana]XP_055312573.1 uncharacterized protein LOC129574518 [Sitodiplosis mosellana]
MPTARPNSCCNWMYIGRTLGWMGIITSIYPTYFGLTMIIWCVIGISMSSLWLYGITKKQSVLMLVPLLYWAFIQTVFMLKLTITEIVSFVREERLKYANKENFENYFTTIYGVMLYTIAAYFVIFFILAVVSFVKIRQIIEQLEIQARRISFIHIESVKNNHQRLH